jgi:hypothetical protein
MSITTYAGLIAELPTWVDNRTSLTDRYPVFVQMCEAKINRLLRCRRMIARADISPSSETLAVPTDFLSAKSLRLTGGSKWELEAISAEDLTDRMGQDDSAGEPQAFSVEGGSFAFWPPPSTATDMRLVYYQAIPGIEANSTNWVLANHFDVYLYGCAAEAWSWLGENDEASKFAGLFTAALGQVADASVLETMADRLTPQRRSTIA